MDAQWSLFPIKSRNFGKCDVLAIALLRIHNSSFFLPSIETKSWKKPKSWQTNQFLSYTNNFNNVNKEFLPKNSSQKILPKNFSRRNSPKEILPKNSSKKIPPKKILPKILQKNSKKFQKNSPKKTQKIPSKNQKNIQTISQKIPKFLKLSNSQNRT